MTGPSGESDHNRALRVKLPLRQHLALHRLKLRTGRSMANVIEAALDRYLQEDPEFAGENVSIGTGPDSVS